MGCFSREDGERRARVPLDAFRLLGAQRLTLPLPCPRPLSTLFSSQHCGIAFHIDTLKLLHAHPGFTDRMTLFEQQSSDLADVWLPSSLESDGASDSASTPTIRVRAWGV
jgi:hypothetical protein